MIYNKNKYFCIFILLLVSGRVFASDFAVTPDNIIITVSDTGTVAVYTYDNSSSNNIRSFQLSHDRKYKRSSIIHVEKMHVFIELEDSRSNQYLSVCNYSTKLCEIFSSNVKYSYPRGLDNYDKPGCETAFVDSESILCSSTSDIMIWKYRENERIYLAKYLPMRVEYCSIDESQCDEAYRTLDQVIGINENMMYFMSSLIAADDNKLIKSDVISLDLLLKSYEILFELPFSGRDRHSLITGKRPNETLTIIMENRLYQIDKNNKNIKEIEIVDNAGTLYSYNNGKSQQDYIYSLMDKSGNINFILVEGGTTNSSTISIECDINHLKNIRTFESCVGRRIEPYKHGYLTLVYAKPSNNELDRSVILTFIDPSKSLIKNLFNIQ